MNAAPPSAQSMESLVALAGMTAFAEDCDRLLKRVPVIPDAVPAAMIRDPSTSSPEA